MPPGIIANGAGGCLGLRARLPWFQELDPGHPFVLGDVEIRAGCRTGGDQGNGTVSRTEMAVGLGKSFGVGRVTGRRASHWTARGMMVWTSAARMLAGWTSPGQTWP